MPEISAAGDAPDTPSAEEQDARNSTSPARKPPVVSLAMLRRAIGNKIASLNAEEVSDGVYKGVLLKDEEKQGEEKNDEDQEPPYTLKYWVQEELNKSCLMVLAKALWITWGGAERYWGWPEEEESCYPDNKNLPVAELKQVCWLEIRGKCETIILSPRTMYEVAIEVKMRRRSYGWEAPVNLSLELPDGTKQGRMERLDRLGEETWQPISIGKFEMTPKTVGEMRFSLIQTDGHWKSGLCVKGVSFTPAAENKQPK